MLFLGIDIGTSGVKAIIMDADGNVRDTASHPLTVDRPQPLWSEQSPADWWEATDCAVRSLGAKLRSGVNSIGLSGQMHGATLLGEGGQVLRPAILWNDGRSAAECRDLETHVADLGVVTGNRAMPGFTAPKLLWLKQHEPDIFKRTEKILLPKDYVRFCLSGDYASDMSDAAGTLWMDTKARKWSTDVLNACGLDVSHMPTLFEGPDITGDLRIDVANRWGMKPVPIVAGGGDNAAGAVGSGVVDKGDGFLSLGTSGVIFLADNGYHPNPDGGLHTFCHALPGLWHQMSVMLSAASAIDWVAGACGFESPAELYETAAHHNRLSDQEIFLPYLSGERTPHNNPHAKGVFFGLGHETDKARLAQAALEGVAFGLADGVNALLDAGAEIKTLSVIGGGAKSEYWGKILASIFDIPLIYRDSGTVGPALGAARLAQIGSTGAAIKDVCKAPPIIQTIEPTCAMRDQLRPRYEQFRSLYTALKPAFMETRS